MAKTKKNVHHKDSQIEDHVHSVPGGGKTLGAIYKPNKDRSFPHTHLYEHDGVTVESGLSPIGAGHTHDVELDEECVETGGPGPVPKGPKEEIPRDRADSARREGSKWVIRADTGALIAKGSTRAEAVKNYEKTK